MKLWIRTLLTAVLVATALAKWIAPGVDDVWLPVWSQWVAGGVELVLAAALWTHLERIAAWGVLALALAGVAAAWLAPGTASGGCGCLGQVQLTQSAHISLAAGIGALAALVAATAQDRQPRTGHVAPTGRAAPGEM